MPGSRISRMAAGDLDFARMTVFLAATMTAVPVIMFWLTTIQLHYALPWLPDIAWCLGWAWIARKFERSFTAAAEGTGK